MKTLLLLILTSFSVISIAQCADEANIYTFTFAGNTYEIIKENKTWTDAAACAVERGGELVRIDSLAENTIIFNSIFTAEVVTASTVAPDGGGGAYLWIGATDRVVEGRWAWDGDNDETGDLFWEGDFMGDPIDGLYNNWGSGDLGGEPDDFGTGQDAAGISVNGWPLGDAGQWNDVDEVNTLFFIVEIEGIDDTGIGEENKINVQLINNPETGLVTIKTTEAVQVENVNVYNASGALMLQLNNPAKSEVNVQPFESGIYIFELLLNDGTTVKEKIIL